MSVLSAIDLNNDDVEEWYARYGEQYSRSVEAMIRGISREDVDEAIEFIGRVYRVDHLLVRQRAGGEVRRIDGGDYFQSDSLTADLYRVETKQRVWSATVTAEIGPYDRFGCGGGDNPYDLGCAFGSYKEAPSSATVWQVLAEELAANFPFWQTSQR